ncbi:D-2-hydroxyacid dehydrogenase [Candidatus Sororendozoicomonas aggregata]|uniref:D-2-hydroxyacid dehydrogenase n=1 Tax=Candidatus Sororendozoicomonas aggregata TaxID=3073239 RepID=UPI002ED0877B
MHGVFLDQSTLNPQDLDLSPLQRSLDTFSTYDHTSNETVIEHINTAEAVITNKVVINRNTMLACHNLKLICVSATGTNNIDLDAARDLGICVKNVTGYATPSVVQHTFALLLALTTNWHQYHQGVKRGHWSRSPFFCLLDYPATELAGKQLGIIGYGELGQGVARVAEAFGMRIAVAESLRRDAMPVSGRIPFDQLIAESDVITVHCPLSDETRNLIDAHVFKAMKNSAFLINVSRGDIVNESDLLAALEQEEIAGAALDVLKEEPPSVNHSLTTSSHPNLIITPHSAWVAKECRQRLVNAVAKNIEEFRLNARK